MIELLQGDITQQAVDAIVNAANSTLMGGGGVDGAIHRAGGPAILEECRVIRTQQGGCPPGQAVLTGGGNLKAKFVIHAVGPIWRGGSSNEAETLASAYNNSLIIAQQNDLDSIAFPSISTGAYGFPVELAAPIAIDTIQAFTQKYKRPSLIRLVLFDASTLAAYRSALARAKL
jgi:O-acetyl-ADP-ribose deacetylase (regulator of RNase III)